MAKTSSVYRNLKRAKMAEKFAEKDRNGQDHFSGREIPGDFEIGRTAPQLGTDSFPQPLQTDRAFPRLLPEVRLRPQRAQRYGWVWRNSGFGKI